eukprot:scaffold8371_cov199-Amphora_coffeaeformis.AAC.4
MPKMAAANNLSPIFEDDMSVGDDTSGDERSPSSGTGDAAVKEVNRIVGDDTKQVRRWRLLVVGVIAVAGVLVSVGINRFLKVLEQEESDDSVSYFADISRQWKGRKLNMNIVCIRICVSPIPCTQFTLFANTIEDVLRLQFRALFDANRNMAYSVTSQALALNMTFPFVTLPNFETYGRQSRLNTGVEAIGWMPHVQTDDLQAFNLYSQQQGASWMKKSQEIERGIEGNIAQYESFDLVPFIYDVSVDPKTGEQSITPASGEGPFTPLWQSSPPPTSPFLLMSNTLSINENPHPQKAVIKTQDTVLGAISDQMLLFTEVILSPSRHQALHDKAPRSGERFEPHASIASPVFDTFDRETRKQVGDVVALFALESFLINLLPEGVNGVYVVVANSCNQAITYVINGNKVIYLGQGDLSDPEYHDNRRNVTFDAYYEDFDIHQKVYESCIYSFLISPSGEFADTFKSNLPIFFAFVIAAIFLIMAVTFMFYDFIVRRRNDRVMSAAVRSTQIVSSLFPSQVRDQLYATAAKSRNQLGSSKSRLRNFVEKGDESSKPEDGVVLRSKPIADLFTDTTVMFADICGFTAWSSVREPSQVFTLLETVYRSFDQ